jgi:hypothetical protein
VWNSPAPRAARAAGGGAAIVGRGFSGPGRCHRSRRSSRCRGSRRCGRTRRRVARRMTRQMRAVLMGLAFLQGTPGAALSRRPPGGTANGGTGACWRSARPAQAPADRARRAQRQHEYAAPGRARPGVRVRAAISGLFRRRRDSATPGLPAGRRGVQLGELGHQVGAVAVGGVTQHRGGGPGGVLDGFFQGAPRRAHVAFVAARRAVRSAAWRARPRCPACRHAGEQ